MPENEITILKGLYAMGFRWICREEGGKNGFIIVFTEKPTKIFTSKYYTWDPSDTCIIDDCGILLDSKFQFITADDKEQTNIEVLLKSNRR